MSVFFSFSSHYLHHTTKANHIVCHFSGDKQPIDQISLPNTLKLNKQAKATYSSLSQKKSKQYHSKQIYGINPLCMKKTPINLTRTPDDQLHTTPIKSNHDISGNVSMNHLLSSAREGETNPRNYKATAV